MLKVYASCLVLHHEAMRIRLALLVFLAVLAVTGGALLARDGDAAASETRCAGAFPPKRPELADFRVTKPSSRTSPARRRSPSSASRAASCTRRRPPGWSGAPGAGCPRARRSP